MEKTYLEILIDEVLKKHPGEGRRLQVTKEDAEKAREAFRISSQKTARLLDNLYAEHIAILGRGRNFVVG